MAKKRRVTLRLLPDEAAVVAPLAFWEQLRRNFLSNAEEPAVPEDAEAWQDAADQVDYWVEHTRVAEKEEESDD